MAANPSGLAHIRRQVSGLQVNIYGLTISECLDEFDYEQINQIGTPAY